MLASTSLLSGHVFWVTTVILSRWAISVVASGLGQVVTSIGTGLLPNGVRLLQVLAEVCFRCDNPHRLLMHVIASCTPGMICDRHI